MTSSSPDRPLADLATRLRFNEGLLRMATGDFGDDHWGLRPAEGANSPHWILGHVTYCRLGMLRMAGEAVPVEPWEADFHRGVTPDSGASYPAPAELIARFNAAGEELGAALARMGPEQAAAPAPREFPDGSNTVGPGLHFMYFHETYHLGQIGYARRIGGLPGFI